MKGPLLALFPLAAIATPACSADRHVPAAPPVPAEPAPPPGAAAADAGPGSSAAPAASPDAAASATAHLAFQRVPLPGATAPVFFDYLAADHAGGRVYIPLANTGTLDVLDVATRHVTSVTGFKTVEREMRGKTRTVGPTAVAIGTDAVYVGNRATDEVCAVSKGSLTVGRCVKVPSPIDGVDYVPWRREVWVTTPGDHALTVLDAARELAVVAVVKTEGEPEGYGHDESRGLFFTNLEDQGGTVAIDVATRTVKARWSPKCGGDGPRGLAVDAARGFVVVACTDHLQVLDAAHDGAILGRLDVGAGIDNLDYVAGKGLILATAGRAALAVLARVDDRGGLTPLATGETAKGSRNGVLDGAGGVYVLDPEGATLLAAAFPVAADR